MNQLQQVDELLTLRDMLRWALSHFHQARLYYGQGTDNAWDEALHLIYGGLHLPLDTDERLLDARLTRDERTHLLTLIEQRVSQQIPVAYLLGESWFAGLPFKVDQRVLIPRSPLAELIGQGFEPWVDESRPPERILDLCTGSGCIGIACAYAFPTAEVMLTDLSTDALAVAEENIRLHHLQERVQTSVSDVFDALDPNQVFDLIIANPPYVDAHDLAVMPDEFRHEPLLALAAGDYGLDIVRRILAQARYFLSDEGLLIVEVGNSEAALQAAYPEVPFLWLDFESQARGVFMLTAQQLDEYQHLFQN